MTELEETLIEVKNLQVTAEKGVMKTAEDHRNQLFSKAQGGLFSQPLSGAVSIKALAVAEYAKAAQSETVFKCDLHYHSIIDIIYINRNKIE